MCDIQYKDELTKQHTCDSSHVLMLRGFSTLGDVVS